MAKYIDMFKSADCNTFEDMHTHTHKDTGAKMFNVPNLHNAYLDEFGELYYFEHSKVAFVPGHKIFQTETIL